MAQYDTATKWSDTGIKLNFLTRQKLLPIKMNDEKLSVCVWKLENILEMADVSAVDEVHSLCLELDEDLCCVLHRQTGAQSVLTFSLSRAYCQ